MCIRDRLLIYAQAPKATAVATYDVWNRIMHRAVKKGSSGIGLIHANRRYEKIDYVFDVSQTVERYDSRPLNIWKITDENESQIREYLQNMLSVDAVSYTHLQKLKSQVKEIVQENRDVRSSIEKGLDKAIQEQIEKSNQLIEAKDQMIRMLNLQMVEHKRRIEELQTKVIHLEKQQEDKYDLGQTTGTAKRVLPQSQSVEYQNKNEDISSELEIISEEIRPEEKKQGVGERLKKYFFSTTATRKFIEKSLNNDKLSDEQKDYLMD